MKTYYKIADLVVALDSFGRIVEQAKPYRVAESTATTTPEPEDTTPEPEGTTDTPLGGDVLPPTPED